MKSYWRWPVAACLLLGAGLVTAAPGADGPQTRKAEKSDKDRLQGKWLMVSGEANGNRFGKELLDMKFTVAVSGDTWDQFIGDESKPDRWSFAIEPSKDPRQIDFTEVPPDATGGRKKIVGIYEFEGEKLRVCSRKPGDEDRPTSFKPGDRNAVIRVYERVK